MVQYNKVTEGGRKVFNQGLANRRAKELAMFRSQDKAATVAAQAQTARPAFATEEDEKKYGGLSRQEFTRRRHAEGAKVDEILAELDKQGGPQDKGGPTSNISRPGPQGDRQTGGTGERTQTLMDSAMMRLPGGEGAKLRGMIKEMNIQQRTSGATGGQNVANMNAPITINGVAPGRESLMAKKAALALRDPIQEGLRQLRAMRQAEARLGYV
jgi:hypothetical protein